MAGSTDKRKGKPEGEKHAGWRPTDYNAKFHTLLAESLARIGLTDKQIAKKIGVSEATITTWKKEHPEFSDALKTGKLEGCGKRVKAIRGSGPLRKRNKETAKKYYAKYYKENKEGYFDRAEKRRSQKAGVLSDLTKEQWDKTVQVFNGECAYCGAKGKLQKEHIIPVSKKGSFTYSNIILACKSCNASKCDSDVWAWYKLKPYFTEERVEKIVEHILYG